MNKRTVRYLSSVLVVLTALVLCILLKGNAAATEGTPTQKPSPTPIQDYVNKEQYLTGYYAGEVTKDDSQVRLGPGSKAYDILTLPDGTPVKLKKGDKVYVWGETKDVDLDVWYHVTGTFKGEEFEGYIYTGRVKRETTQIQFTPTPSPSPSPTIAPTTPAEADITGEIKETTTQPLPTDSNVAEITEKSSGGKFWFVLLIVCFVAIALIVIYTIFQRVQEKKLEEEMDRYSKQRPPLERLDGEDEESFREAKKQYYASMKIGRSGSREEAAYEPIDDEFTDDDLNLDKPKKPSHSDAYEDVSLSDEDEKIMNDFRANANLFEERKPASKDINDDYSDDDMKYFEKLQGKIETPSSKALAAAGSTESILGESPVVSSCFEDDEPTPEEKMRAKLDTLRPEEHFIHKLYGEGEVVDNSDSDIIQVRFGRDLRFLKKDKLAAKDLIEF